MERSDRLEAEKRRQWRLMALARLVIVSALIGVAVSYSVIYLFHVVLAVWLLSVAVQLRNGIWLRRLPDVSHRFLYGMFAWYGVSVIWSIEPLYSVQYLAYLFFGICVVAATLFVARGEGSLRGLLRIVGAVIAIEVFLSLLEALTPFRLPISPYSSVVHLFSRESVVEGTLEQQVIQQYLSSPTGFQWNPNDLAGTLVIVLPFCLLHRSKALRVLGSLSVLIVIAFTGSRASYVAVAVTLGVWAYAFSARRALLVSVAMACGVLALPVALNAMKASDDSRLSQAAALGTMVTQYATGQAATHDSVALRSELIRNGIRALRDSHWLGVGGGGSKAVQEEAGGKVAEVRSMHNFWVEVAVDAGVVVGLLFVLWYLWLLGRIYMVALLTRQEFLRYVSMSLACSMAGFSVAMISSSSVVYVLPMWLMFGLVCAVLNIDRANRSPNREMGNSQVLVCP